MIAGRAFNSTTGERPAFLAIPLPRHRRHSDDLTASSSPTSAEAIEHIVLPDHVAQELLHPLGPGRARLSDRDGFESGLSRPEQVSSQWMLDPTYRVHSSVVRLRLTALQTDAANDAVRHPSRLPLHEDWNAAILPERVRTTCVPNLGLPTLERSEGLLECQRRAGPELGKSGLARSARMQGAKHGRHQ
jgi:hypothetical protein